jgi:hypothetical protein
MNMKLIFGRRLLVKNRSWKWYFIKNILKIKDQFIAKTIHCRLKHRKVDSLHRNTGSNSCGLIDHGI